jgi:hypothetical protein
MSIHMATNALFNEHCPANIRLAFIFSDGGVGRTADPKGRGSAWGVAAQRMDLRYPHEDRQHTVTVGISSVSARQPTVSARTMNGE